MTFAFQQFTVSSYKPVFIFLAPYWNSSQQPDDLETFFFEIWRMWAIFSMENPVYRSKSYFRSRFCPKKNTATNRLYGLVWDRATYKAQATHLKKEHHLQEIFWRKDLWTHLETNIPMQLATPTGATAVVPALKIKVSTWSWTFPENLIEPFLDALCFVLWQKETF